jgi:hypothetical protein
MVQPASLIANAAMGSVQCNNDSGVRNFSGQGNPGRDEERCPRWGLDEDPQPQKRYARRRPWGADRCQQSAKGSFCPDSAELGNCAPCGSTLPLPCVGQNVRGEKQWGTHAPAWSHCRDRASEAAPGTGLPAPAQPPLGPAEACQCRPGRACQLAASLPRRRGPGRAATGQAGPHQRLRRPQAMWRC